MRCDHWPEIPPREIHAFRAFGEHGVAYLNDRLEGKPLERMRAHEPDYSEFPEKVREEIRGQRASNNRHTAARLLGDLGKDAAAAIPFLEKAANEEDWFIKGGAKVALMKIRNESIDPLLNELTSTLGHPNLYRTAIMVGQFGPQAEKAVPVLLEMLENPETMDAHALDVLGMIGLRPEKSVPALAGFLDHPIRAHRQKAITALMSFGKHNEKVLPTLQSAIKDKDPFVSFRAKWIIGMLNR